MVSRLSLWVFVLLQLICAVYLTTDILSALIGVPPLAWRYHELFQIGAAIALMGGVVLGAGLLHAMARRHRRMEGQLRVASGAFYDVLDEHFVQWSLTPAERDVALLAIKGLSTAEIARVRNTSDGTVKAQTNAIYRKAGVTGRPQLLSLFIEDLMGETLVTRSDGAVTRLPSEREPLVIDAKPLRM